MPSRRSARAIPGVVIGLSAIAFTGRASADVTWINGANNLWSNPNNWSPTAVPQPGENLVIGGPAGQIVQDIGDPFVVGNMQLLGPTKEIAGSALSLTQNATVSSAFSAHRFRAPVIVSINATVDAIGGYVNESIAFDDLRGNGNLALNGHVVIFGGTYAGTTTVGPIARLWIGGKQFIGALEPGITSGQGSYFVDGGLLGTGTIGLANGASVNLRTGGYISPSGGFTIGANDLGQLTIDGALSLASGSYVAIDTSLGTQIVHDRIDVTGVLDLSAPNDNLFVSNSAHFGLVPQQSFVVASYGSRIGEFDLLNNGTNPNYQIIYTSASGAGPGQVIIVTPEPSAAACLFAGFSLAMRRRVRSNHAS